MQIKIWTNFSKRVNSTKQPTGGTTVDVLLKNETDILQPVFILNNLDFSINYCQAFGNYYFVQVTNLDGHRSELHCSLDHLATFKTQIGAYNGLIEYTSSSSNVFVTDPRNKPTLELAISFADFVWTSGKALDANNGTFILSFISDQANSTGLCKYVAMDWYALSQFSYELFTQNILDEIVKQFTNMTNSLVSLMWLPIAYGDLTGTVTSTFTVGSQPITLSDSQGKILTDRIFELETGSIILGIPSPATGVDARKTYLAKAPYLTSEIYLPYIGITSMSDDICAYYDNQNLTLKGAIDVFTGDIVYMLMVNGMKIATYSGNCATHLPISSASYNAFSAATGTAVAVGGLAASAFGFATGNPMAGVKGLGAMAGGAAATMKSLAISTQINGNNSSALGQKLGVSPRITCIMQKPINTDLLAYKAKHGMPYFKVATISSLSGYVQCADASVDIPGDGAEQDTVNNYLNSGFYYE